MIKITKKEIRELLELYKGIRKRLDADGEREAMDFICNTIYVNGDNADGCNNIHQKLSRFCESMFDDNNDILKVLR